MLAGGGECVSDLGAVRDQQSLFGEGLDRVPGGRPGHLRAAACESSRVARAGARVPLEPAWCGIRAVGSAGTCAAAAADTSQRKDGEGTRGPRARGEGWR